MSVRLDVKVLFVEIIKFDKPVAFVLIDDKCEANVLLVDITRFDKLVLFVFISPKCDVKVELVFETTVFIAFCVATDTGLFKSDVLSTLPKPIESFDTPWTVPVNCGLFTGAIVPPSVNACKVPSGFINDIEFATISTLPVILHEPTLFKNAIYTILDILNLYFVKVFNMFV